ncbi:hypothetical protein SAMN04487761_10833 [Lachnospiraceae bacterium C7]|nr:hypothetical protein SAMN04487761_10833 [Lachnospiraceae bacterium C7]
MPFQIVRNDITKMHVDAIVNTANPMPGYGAGIDSAVYEAAEEEIDRLISELDDAGKDINKLQRDLLKSNHQ